MSDDLKQKFGIQRKRNYLARDFDGFREDLLRYAKTYFGDKIQDFSEASMGGLFLDMAAYIGDNMSFYLDHQFRELSPTTAVEPQNIETMIREAGVKITGKKPATVTLDFYINIPLNPNLTTPTPYYAALPIIRANSQVIGEDNIMFYTIEDCDFGEKDESGIYKARINTILDGFGNISSYVFIKSVTAVSGKINTNNYTFGPTLIPYNTIMLPDEDISAILRVYDSEGNEYYEVESLAQDTIYKKNKLISGENSIEVINTSYRFIVETSLSSRKTKLRFGSGNSETVRYTESFSNLALPLYGKDVFSSFSLDPNQLLRNPSMGLSPVNTTITVITRSGGGLNHNVGANALIDVYEINWKFNTGLDFSIIEDIKNTVAVTNPESASGGADAPSIDQLKNQVTNYRSMQNRIVTKEDLLSRLYTMPSDFGSIYRANIIPNPENSLGSILYICSLDKFGNISQTSDSFKKVLSTYINEYRLIGDAIDILDANVINYSISVNLSVSNNINKNELISNVIKNITSTLSGQNVSLGKNINLTSIQRSIINIPGIVSINSIECTNKSGNDIYSLYKKNLSKALVNKEYLAEPYEIYELRYPNEDIFVTIQS